MSPAFVLKEPVVSSDPDSPLTGITDINAGFQSTCLVADGSPMCFGNNGNYQLGISNGGVDVLYPTEPTVTLSSDQEVISVHVGERTGHVVTQIILFMRLEEICMEL